MKISGTTYPSDRAPAGSVRLPARERLRDMVRRFLGVVPMALRPKDNDVIVVRCDSPVRAAEANRLLRAAGFRGVLIHLPLDSMVHLEPSKLAGEDRGYRETKTYGADSKTNTDDRGVHTGLPGQVKPHPLSESGEDDPHATR